MHPSLQTSTTHLAVGPLLAMLLDAQAQTMHSLRRPALRQSANAVAAEAVALGARHIHGASDSGMSLAGAACFANEQLSMWPAGTVADVVLVDGWLAGLSGLELVAERMRALGATTVHAIVLGMVDGAEDLARPSSVDRLSVLADTRLAAA